MEHHKILVVDDDPLICRTLVDLLKVQDYAVEAVEDGPLALASFARQRPDLVLLDLIMPDMDGYEVARRLRADPAGIRMAIVMITGRDISVEKTKALEAGADDILSKPICIPELLARVRTTLSAKDHRDRLENERAFLEKEVANQTAALRAALAESSAAAAEIIHRLARAAEFRDDNTGAHIERVSRYAEVIAEAMGMEPEACRLMRLAATMHDVGKIGVPDDILRKPESLTPQEREIMEHHTHIGGQILHGSSIELIRLAATIAAAHHERWDGQGYPARLRGKAVPLPARIVAVADALDAMTSTRPYHRGMSMDEAFKEIAAMSGVQFDPDVVATCLAMRERLIAILTAYPRQG
jgi:putative two-component system response regulator